MDVLLPSISQRTRGRMRLRKRFWCPRCFQHRVYYSCRGFYEVIKGKKVFIKAGNNLGSESFYTCISCNAFITKTELATLNTLKFKKRTERFKKAVLDAESYRNQDAIIERKEEACFEISMGE